VILFLEDWYRYPTAIVHHNTSNKTFLKVAELYKAMGVQNYYFHLALLQPELEFIDPHSPNLTDDQKVMIGIECRYNPWYYFREVARVPPQAGHEPVQLRANRGNIALWWCFFNHIDIALIQPRQTGKSLSTDELMEYLLDIGSTNTDINMLTKDDQLRKANVDRLKEIRDLLPGYISQKTKKDSDNKEELTCKALNNSYRTSVAQNSALAANNVGRGLTSPVMHIDEGPFINHIDVTMPAMLAAGTAARDEAACAGAFYGNVFTTTAGKKDTRSGKYFYDILQGGMVWTEKLYDCKNQISVQKVLEMNCKGKKHIINATFSHKQLGYSDEWLIKTIRNVGATPEEADRDFFNRWTSGTTSSPLSVEINQVIRDSEKEATHIEITPENYILRWYIPESDIDWYMRNNKVVLGMDTSEAIGRDSITMVLIDVKTLNVVAGGYFNETNLIRFSGFVSNLMIKHQNITLIPERRSTGQTIIDTLLIRLPAAGIDPFRRIFNKVVDNASQRESDYKEIRVTDMHRRSNNWYDKWKSEFGFATASSGQYSRNALYSDVLQTAARRGGHRVNDKSLIGEITSLVVKKGRIDHSDGEHDDMVIAWLLGCWMLIYGKNLSYYGIENAMSEAYEVSNTMTEEDDMELLMKKQRQQRIREEMEELLEKMKNEENEFISVKYEHRLKVLDSQLGGTFSSNDSLDALIQEAKDIRSRKGRIGGRMSKNIERPMARVGYY
jgi:hypothetical protein